LPLAQNYSTTFRVFDIRTQKEQLMDLKVIGVESVTVPAGTFESYKVEMTQNGGRGVKTTLWIAEKSRKTVKVLNMVPEANATVTLELVD